MMLGHVVYFLRRQVLDELSREPFIGSSVTLQLLKIDQKKLQVKIFI